MPLLNLGSYARAPYERVPDVDSPDDDDDSVLDIDDGQDDGPKGKRKRWWMYLPLLLLLVLMFAPHYSILVLLVSYYLKIHDSPFLFSLHLSVIYLITFLASCSLLICVVRDPGAIRVGEDATSHSDTQEESDGENEETDMMDILRMNPSPKPKRRAPEAFDDDFNAPHKWCKKCWAPKPERTHHCSACGRCVLKMDHHCPWLAQKCVGHWTYTAFLHFLCCVTLLSVYVGFLAGRIVYVAFVDSFLVNERTALHALFLTMYGAVFSLVVGSFFFWHAYLASTNQTTIENISPFLLLRYLPKLPSAPSAPSAPPTNEGRTPPPTGNSVLLNSPFPPRPPSLHPVSEPTTSPAHLSSTPTPHPNGQPILARNRSTGSELSSVPPSSGLGLGLGLGPGPNAIHIPHEYQLTSSQRRAVRSAHSRIRLYDVGFRANWAQLIGIGGAGGVDNINRNRTSGSARWRWWKGVTYRILCGGGGMGDGKKWPRNPRAEGMLLRLARELASEDKVD